MNLIRNSLIVSLWAVFHLGAVAGALEHIFPIPATSYLVPEKPSVRYDVPAPVKLEEPKIIREYGLPKVPLLDYGLPLLSHDYGVPKLLAPPALEYDVPHVKIAEPLLEYGVPKPLPVTPFKIPLLPHFGGSRTLVVLPSGEHPVKPLTDYGLPIKPAPVYGVPPRIILKSVFHSGHHLHPHEFPLSRLF